MINYVKGSLFENEDAFLLHACNCLGQWSHGVAFEFASRFPGAYETHRGLRKSPAAVGSIQVLRDKGRVILCLFTSYAYGNRVDKPEIILQNTEKSLRVLGNLYKEKTKIASPKINAGLFNVPWEKTEALIEKFLTENPHVEWSVYCP